MSDKAKKIVILIMIIVFILIFLICSYILIKNFLDFEESKSENTKLINDVIDVPINNKNIENSKNSKDNEDSEYIANNESHEMIVNWNKLENINKDIIGWIKINDTKINYPILQDSNLYYLNHTYYNKYNRNGSIFTQTRNPFETKETVIYGHNNRNGIMFNEIENFMDVDFFDRHQTFQIYTKNANYDAKVFSIYSIGIDEENQNIKNLSFDECVEYYKNQSKFKRQNQDITDNIIKLSTCSYLNNKETPTEQRYYLVSSLVKN